MSRVLSPHLNSSLASGSDDGTIRLWDVGQLSQEALRLYQQDTGFIDKLISEYHYHLNGIDLEPEKQPLNLLVMKSQPARWSRHHPLYWLPKADQGNIEVIIQLGLIYNRSYDFERASFWYQKASAAGNSSATRYLHNLECWQAQKQALKIEEDVQELNETAQ